MNIFPSKENALDSPGFLFWKISNEWQKQINNKLSKYDLTHTQFVLLAGIGYLTEREEEVSQKKLADHASTDQMTTSSVVRKLLEKEYIDRKESKVDTRVKLLSLTKPGITVLKKTLKEVMEIDSEFFDMQIEEKSIWMDFLRKIYKKNCG